MASRDIRWQIFIAWDGTSYVNEAARLIDINGVYELTAPGVSALSGRGIISECTITLQNADNRYSAMNSSGALYANLVAGAAWQRPMYVNVSIDGGSNYHRVFTGILHSIAEQTVTTAMINSVTIVCRSLEDKYMTTRVSTSKAQFAAWVDAPPTEAEIIEQFLSDAGISSGDMALDDGMFSIPFAWMDDESCIEECWSVASSCGGRFYYDVINAKFVYENASHWLRAPHLTASSSAPDNTLTRADYQSLSLAYTSDLYADITVEYGGRVVDDPGEVWTPDEEITVPSDSAIELSVTYRQPVYSVSGISYHATTAGGVDITSDVTAALSDQKAQRATLTVTNANTSYAAHIHGLSVAGAPVGGGPEGEVETSSVNSYWTARGRRKRAVRGSVWVQTYTHADLLANLLLHIHELPIALYTLNGVNGDPERNLGDRISITDADVLGGSTQYAYITRINWRGSNQGFIQDISAIDANDLYTYAQASDANDYFVIGTDEIGDAANPRGRLFF